jgi:hypothetical protein
MVFGDRIEWDAITNRLLVCYSGRGRHAKWEAEINFS